MAKDEKCVALVVDKSGSMEAVRQQVISGTNEYLQMLRGEKKVSLSLTFFDTEVKSPYVNVAVDKVPDLSVESYRPSGMTALYDAIGQTVAKTEASLTGKKPKVLVVIQTDGEENSSKEYTREKIRDLIAAKEKEGNWTFVFLGADQDAWLAAAPLGISQSNSLSYESKTTGGTISGPVATATRNLLRSANAQTRDFFDNSVPAGKK